MVILNLEPKDFSSLAKKRWQEIGRYYECSFDDLANLNIDINEVEVIIVRLSFFLDKAFLTRFPKLKYIISATTGLDHIDQFYVDSSGIKIISLRDELNFLNSIPSTAELTWGLILSLLRNIPEAVYSVKQGHWNRDKFKGFQLKGKSIGIIGLGRIGQKVAKYSRAFELKVSYYDPYVDIPDYNKLDKLEDLIETSNIISLHLHLSEKTINLVNPQLESFFQKGSYLINTSRGKLVDEEFIVNLLEKKILAGYACDVLDSELTDIRNSRIYQAQQSGLNILITPHIGGASYDAMLAAEEYIALKAINIID